MGRQAIFPYIFPQRSSGGRRGFAGRFCRGLAASQAVRPLAQHPLAGSTAPGSVSGMEAPTATAEVPLQQDRLLRPDQAAWYLNVKTSWVYEAVRAGRLPCYRVGRHVRFTRPMLDAWLAEQPRQ